MKSLYSIVLSVAGLSLGGLASCDLVQNQLTNVFWRRQATSTMTIAAVPSEQLQSLAALVLHAAKYYKYLVRQSSVVSLLLFHWFYALTLHSILWCARHDDGRRQYA